MEQINKKRLIELTDNIIEWGKEKGIIDGFGTVEGQKSKTIEELSELDLAVRKEDKEAIIDAIGDVYVTLVLGNILESGFLGAVLLTTCFDGYEKHCPFLRLEVLQRRLKASSYFAQSFCIVQSLLGYSELYILDFLDCVESAYNVISKRTGKMVNGVFVKDN